MLKQARLHPPDPKRAKTRSFRTSVLGSKASSTYPWMRGGLGRLGAGRVTYRYASGSFLAAALLIDHFEHPTSSLSALIC